MSPNIALKAFLIHPSNFIGLSCTANQRPRPLTSFPNPDGHSRSDKSTDGDDDDDDAVRGSLLNFKCHTMNSSSSPVSQFNKVSRRMVNVVNASRIFYPALLFTFVGKVHQFQPEATGMIFLFLKQLILLYNKREWNVLTKWRSFGEFNKT